MKICAACGTKNVNRSLFCSKCGKKLSDKTLSKKKRKLGRKARIALISVGSFFGAVILVFVGFLLYIYYGPPGQYYREYIQYGSEHSIEDLISHTDKPGFGDLEIASRIDKNTFKPLGLTDEFELGFREVYSSIYVLRVNPDDEFTFIWKDNNSGDVIIDYTNKYFTTNGYIPNYISIPPEEDINDFKIFSQPGLYTIEFYHNGQLIDTAGFHVVESEPTSTQETIQEDAEQASEEEIWFSSFITCEDIKEQEPVNPREIFEYGTNKICAVIYSYGATAQDEWMYKWKTGSGEEVTTYSSKYNPKNGQYTDEHMGTCSFIPEGSSLDTNEILNQPGTHCCEFYHNGQLIDTAVFMIKDDDTLEFGKLYVCEPWGESKAPLFTKQEFKTGIPELNIQIYVYGADIDDEFEFTVMSVNRSKIVSEYSNKYGLFAVEGADSFSGYAGVNIHLPEGDSPANIDVLSIPGEYLVEFYHNGDFISKYTFYMVE
jgi:hypothetical protein